MKSRLLLFQFLFLLTPILAWSNQTNSFFQDIYQEEILRVELTTDLTRLGTNIENLDYQPAVFGVFDASGSLESTWNIKVKARGKYRYRVCDFPPLKLNFKKGELRNAGLSEFDSYKLVTHCFADEAEARDNVQREYLTYKLFNEVTSQSFRVQLVEVTYRDINDLNLTETRWGFIIENTKEMSARIGGTEEELLNQPKEAFDAKAEQLMSVFQYLIGNTDFDLKMVRNVKLIRIEKTGKLVPVPYDFDFAFSVDAEYAVANNNVGQYRISDRVYLGFERDSRETKYMDTFFRSMQKSLEGVIKDSKFINRSNRTHVLRVLDTYFTDEAVRNGIYVSGVEVEEIEAVGTMISK